MAKIIFSGGFWITLVLFVALGYAFGDECPGSMSCVDGDATFSPSASEYQNRTFETDARTSDFARSRCAPASAWRGADPSFPQFANWQRGGSTYAPGLSITMTRRSPHVTLCPGPVEIPETVNQ